MKNLKPYLIFPGTCRKALEFYKQSLGGEIHSILTFGESPIDFPEETNHYIFNSDFRADGIHFLASDNPSDKNPDGSNFALFVTFSDETELTDTLEKLSSGGKVIMPFEGTFGMLKDPFGVQWMLCLEG